MPWIPSLTDAIMAAGRSFSLEAWSKRVCFRSSILQSSTAEFWAAQRVSELTMRRASSQHSRLLRHNLYLTLRPSASTAGRQSTTPCKYVSAKQIIQLLSVCLQLSEGRTTNVLKSTSVTNNYTGWAACPQELYIENTCNSNLSWTTGPMKWSTVMSVYQQFTTTTYNMENLAIVNTQVTSDPELLFLNASDYAAILNRVLVPNQDSTLSDNSNVNSLIYSLTWMQRTYNVGDDRSLMNYLYNFLVVPQAFIATALQLINAFPFPLALDDFPMLNDTITIATGSWSKSRLVILPWTGYLFIAMDVVVLLFILGGIIWILLQSHPQPSLTGIGELDNLRYAENVYCGTQPWKSRRKASARFGENVKDQPTPTLIEFAHNLEVSSSSSSRELSKTLRKLTIVVIEDTEHTGVQTPLQDTVERPYSPLSLQGELLVEAVAVGQNEAALSSSRNSQLSGVEDTSTALDSQMRPSILADNSSTHSSSLENNGNVTV
jgi:hypothetical protein